MHAVGAITIICLIAFGGAIPRVFKSVVSTLIVQAVLLFLSGLNKWKHHSESLSIICLHYFLCIYDT